MNEVSDRSTMKRRNAPFVLLLTLLITLIGGCNHATSDLVGTWNGPNGVAISFNANRDVYPRARTVGSDWNVDACGEPSSLACGSDWRQADHRFTQAAGCKGDELGPEGFVERPDG